MGMLKGKRVLVVDDTEADRMLISLYLQQLGCRLFHAQDGFDGINKARLLLPDIILMDLDMPECNGYVATRAITQDPATAHIPIVFLSAYCDPEKRVQGLLSGAVDYIAKPYDFEEVRLRLMVHMRRAVEEGVLTEQGAEQQEEPAVDSVSHQRNINNILFQSARVHLLNSLAEAPSIHELAARVGTNSKRLNQAFKYCAGATVFEYLRELRMKEARELLLHTGLNISEIACRVGFSSSANFATAFRERFGATPSRFRQQGGDDAPR